MSYQVRTDVYIMHDLQLFHQNTMPIIAIFKTLAVVHTNLL